MGVSFIALATTVGDRSIAVTLKPFAAKIRAWLPSPHPNSIHSACRERLLHILEMWILGRGSFQKIAPAA